MEAKKTKGVKMENWKKVWILNADRTWKQVWKLTVAGKKDRFFDTTEDVNDWRKKGGQ